MKVFFKNNNAAMKLVRPWVLFLGAVKRTKVLMPHVLLNETKFIVICLSLFSQQEQPIVFWFQ
ncbi:hypothetical protein [Neopusillimonas maritima]|uniref:Uncharacterized protein n=1 Tax=Neopusillimonas maritima TaxID=2026239 RepID=A0A3A1YSS6_9BURK|nr:hypothetical protein [Neopusillimonas maritima]RIY40551.1 hypothetical protein CJP73_10525 [Neopusillimonas maritima]